MLAAAVQLPVVVLGAAPEASAGTASMDSAQIADATNLVLMAIPPLFA
jgi:hypothetical protein